MTASRSVVLSHGVRVGRGGNSVNRGCGHDKHGHDDIGEREWSLSRAVTKPEPATADAGPATPIACNMRS